MEYYDNLTFDPDRGVYLDKDGYPLEARNGALSQPDLSSLVSSHLNASTDHLALQAVGATDRIKIGNSTAGKVEIQPGLTNQQIVATSSDPNSDITLIPKGIGVVSCSTYFLHVDSLTNLQTINLSGTSPIERVVMSNVVTNTFPASILTWVSNDRIQNNSGRTLVGLISSDTRGEWQGSWPNGLLGYGYTAGTELTLDKYWYGTLRIVAPNNSQPQQSISGCSIIEIKPGEQMSVWIRAVSGTIIIGTSDITRLAHRNHMTFKLLV